MKWVGVSYVIFAACVALMVVSLHRQNEDMATWFAALSAAWFGIWCLEVEFRGR